MKLTFFFFSHENISFFVGCILRNVLKALKTANEVLFCFFSVAANLRKVIDNPPSSKSMMFPLVSVDNTIQWFFSV